MIDKTNIEVWAYDCAPTKILRALCRAWLYAELLQQNAGQYRAGVIEPAIEDAIAQAKAMGLLPDNAGVQAASVASPPATTC